MRRLRLFLCALVGVAIGAGAVPVAADEFPSRAVRIVVPFAPGAGNDLLGRLFAEHLTPRLKQPVFVENKPGAGSQIGIDLVAKSAPDGYNLVWAASDGISILPAVKPKMPYRVPEDFTFVSRIVVLPFALVVRNDLQVSSVAELLAYAKANPGRLKYGTSGIGGAPHMGTVMLENRAGIKMIHVPYKGVAPAVNDLLGGHIDIAFVTPPTIRPHAENKKVRVIATTGNERHALFPGMPTLREAGLDLSVIVWYGILAPARTPAPVVDRLRREIADVIADPVVANRLRTLGYQVSPLVGEEFQRYVLGDLNQWRAVAKSENIVVED